MTQFSLLRKFGSAFLGMLLLAFMISFAACKSDSSASQEEGMTDDTEMTEGDMANEADMAKDAEMAEDADMAKEGDMAGDEKGPDYVYDIADEMPHFPGCEGETDLEERKKCSDKKLYEYIYKHLEYPAEAKDKNIEGTTMVEFVVDKSGAIRDIQMIKRIGGGCDEETERVLTSMQEEGIVWNPGIHNGNAVNVKMILPVKYALE